MDALQVITFTSVAALFIAFAQELPSAIGNVGLTLPFFDEFLKWVAIAYGSKSGVDPLKLRDYMKYLANMVTGSIVWEKYANQVGGFIAFAALDQAGWDIVGGAGWSTNFLPGISNDLQGLHVVAANIIDGRRVTVFIHVEAKLGVSEVEEIATTIEQITKYARNFVNSVGSLGEGSTAVTVLIAFDTEPGAVDQLVAALQQNDLQTPVIILYPENGQWLAKCVGNCSDKKFLDAVANALASALGQPPQEGSESALGEMLRKFEQAMQNAQMAYLGYSGEAAWWLAYGVCGADLGCILFLSEQIAKELREQCGGPCPVPTSHPRALPTRKQW